MSKKRKAIRNSRDAPTQTKSAETAFLCNPDTWKILCGDGYKPLSKCPEVQTCVGIYADLIASMTIHLMENTDDGDIRIRNELSRKLDIEPNRFMTRHAFMTMLVWALLMNGNQVTYPEYRNGYLDNLKPLEPSRVSFRQAGDGYVVRYNGQEFDPDEVLHFMMRPDPERPFEGMGFQVALKDVVRSIRQANATRQALMESPAPSIIVKVDGLTEEFSSLKGRKALAEQYLDSSENGRPWFIPAEAFAVEQVKPLTINDLAVKDNLDLDKRAVAAIFGIPPFMIGVGDFNQVEYNNFISTRVMAIAKSIEQELTRKLLISDRWYWRFNNRSLLSYDITALVNAGSAMVDRMAMTRNEWRDLVGFTPREGMNELLGLENYIPVDRLGDQEKLRDPDGGGEKDA